MHLYLHPVFVLFIQPFSRHIIVEHGFPSLPVSFKLVLHFLCMLIIIKVLREKLVFKTKICHFELIWLQTTLQVHMFTEHIRLCN